MKILLFLLYPLLLLYIVVSLNRNPSTDACMNQVRKVSFPEYNDASKEVKQQLAVMMFQFCYNSNNNADDVNKVLAHIREMKK